jgi:hypothetical protein
VPNPITIVEADAEPGLPVGATVQPCSQFGIIVVTLVYGHANLDHDVEVYLGQSYISRQVNGNRTTFIVEKDALYDVQLHSISKAWTVQPGYKYRGRGKPNHHSSIQILLIPRPALMTTSIDHHFAPGKETLNAYYTTKNLGAHKVRLTVRGTNYPNDIVYQVDDVDSTDGRHNIAWQGTANRGPLNGRPINPLHSPYTIRIEADTAGLLAEAQFLVLYHSVTLAIGTYTADGKAPKENADLVKWIQYKLNELGYFSGPVDGNIGNQTVRAMNRYAFQHPDLHEDDPENSSVPTVGGRFRGNNRFKAALRNNEQRRTIIQNNRMPNPDESVRIYIDHNYFYYTRADFSNDTGHVALNRKKLDRFELPLEATIRLIGQADSNGTGGGVVSPGAVGEVSVEWAVDEVPEDTSNLPDGTDRNKPSRTRQYVKAALAATRDGAGRDNCPTTHGGARQAVNPNQGYFRIGTDLPPFVSNSPGGDVVRTPVYQGVGAKRGKAGILFRGSYIAGDNYRITAKISFRGLPNKDALETAHSQTMNNQAWDDILLARTGRMTIWRQHRIASVVNWPAPASGINWAQVAAEYALAYCELDYAHIDNITAAALRNRHFQGDALAPTFEGAVGGVIRQDLRNNIGNVVWDNASLYHTNYQPPAQGSHKVRRYIQLVKADAGTKISTEFLQRYAEGVVNFVPERGSIIIHGRWIRPVSATHRALWGQGRQEDFEIPLFCIGLTRGVVILSHVMYPDYQDRFIVPHEMGHSRFLNHHETGSSPRQNPINPHSDTPTHHDLVDHNCTMCYPFGIPSRNRLFRRKVSWAPNSPDRASFCGKCILKLRGWDITTGPMPARS